MAKKLIAALNDSSLFLREWLANPQRTGAVAPSSPKLAAAMARWLPSDPESYVLELGPGTGAVTQALIERGLREERLVAIEKNPKLARLLRQRFPAPTSSPATRGIWTFCCGNATNRLKASARSFPACRC